MTDLTNVIDSTDRALVIAHMLVRLAPESPPGPQPSCVEPMLATLLHAASSQDTGRGMDWVYAVLASPEEQSLTAAVTAVGARTDPQWLRHYDHLEPQDRRSVVAALRHAIGPWIQPPHRATVHHKSGETTCVTGRFG
jgi:hypothetical protein